MIVILSGLMLVLGSSPSWAGFQDDRYDGNIFALYGSNGGMVPPRVTVEQATAQKVPAVLVYYIDDSKDCKQYAPAIANLQVRYGLGVYFIPYAIDGLDLSNPGGPGQYFTGRVPQTVIFDPSGEIVYESVGNRPISEVENAIRSIFGLSLVDPDNYQARPFNEIQIGFGSGSLPRTDAAPQPARSTSPDKASLPNEAVSPDVTAEEPIS